MLKSIFSLLLFTVIGLTVQSQEKEKIKVISRAVDGEIRTLYNDTLFGTVQVDGTSDYHITSIIFKENGKKKVKYGANDIKRFRQIVPFPDRPDFGVEEVYYQSTEDPKNPYKKVFLPIEEWK